MAIINMQPTNVHCNSDYWRSTTSRSGMFSQVIEPSHSTAHAPQNDSALVNSLIHWHGATRPCVCLVRLCFFHWSWQCYQHIELCSIDLLASPRQPYDPYNNSKGHSRFLALQLFRHTYVWRVIYMFEFFQCAGAHIQSRALLLVTAICVK